MHLSWTPKRYGRIKVCVIWLGPELFNRKYDFLKSKWSRLVNNEVVCLQGNALQYS